MKSGKGKFAKRNLFDLDDYKGIASIAVRKDEMRRDILPGFFTIYQREKIRSKSLPFQATKERKEENAKEWHFLKH